MKLQGFLSGQPLDNGDKETALSLAVHSGKKCAHDQSLNLLVLGDSFKKDERTDDIRPSADLWMFKKAKALASEGQVDSAHTIAVVNPFYEKRSQAERSTVNSEANIDEVDALLFHPQHVLEFLQQLAAARASSR